jgi:hypothetical protein
LCLGNPFGCARLVFLFSFAGDLSNLIRAPHPRIFDRLGHASDLPAVAARQTLATSDEHLPQTQGWTGDRSRWCCALQTDSGPTYGALDPAAPPGTAPVTQCEDLRPDGLARSKSSLRAAPAQ